jgi:hypothetical protein
MLQALLSSHDVPFATGVSVSQLPSAPAPSQEAVLH